MSRIPCSVSTRRLFKAKQGSLTGGNLTPCARTCVFGRRFFRDFQAKQRWRNRSRFLTGTDEIIAFLTEKWEREHDYRLIKELWAFTDDRIAVRFAYEWRSDAGQWFRAYGNENWLFDEEGLMAERHASINDVAIEESERKFRWDASGPRPADHPGLTELGL